MSVTARTEADPTSLAGAVAALETLDLTQLRVRFRNHTGRIAPARLSRTLLLRVLAYRIQADALGDLRPETRRMLARLAEAGAGDRRAERAGGAENASAAGPAPRPAAVARSSVPAHRPAPQPGTVLVREWQGAMEQVSVVSEGYSWRGATYPSLSAVALAITGTKWNGRRFFGLDRPATKAGARP